MARARVLAASIPNDERLTPPFLRFRILTPAPMFVRASLERIFDYRRHVASQLFGDARAAPAGALAAPDERK